ncbi:hypothetical protein R6G99_05225, partial [Actinotignum timonense]|nr:hypothetical protein [Actinotignum timonense]
MRIRRDWLRLCINLDNRGTPTALAKITLENLLAGKSTPRRPPENRVITAVRPTRIRSENITQATRGKMQTNL